MVVVFDTEFIGGMAVPPAGMRTVESRGGETFFGVTPTLRAVGVEEFWCENGPTQLPANQPDVDSTGVKYVSMTLSEDRAGLWAGNLDKAIIGLQLQLTGRGGEVTVVGDGTRQLLACASGRCAAV